MKAAVVESFERPPRYATFREPVVGAGEVVVKVRAAALSNLVKGQASGKHYSSGSELPFVPASTAWAHCPMGGVPTSSGRLRRSVRWRSGVWPRPAGRSCCQTRSTT